MINRDYYFFFIGECILILSLPGKASRTLVESRGLSSDSTSVLEAEPGKLGIKIREPIILFISLQRSTCIKGLFWTHLEPKT